MSSVTHKRVVSCKHTESCAAIAHGKCGPGQSKCSSVACHTLSWRFLSLHLCHPACLCPACILQCQNWFETQRNHMQTDAFISHIVLRVSVLSVLHEVCRNFPRNACEVSELKYRYCPLTPSYVRGILCVFFPNPIAGSVSEMVRAYTPKTWEIARGDITTSYIPIRQNVELTKHLYHHQRLHQVDHLCELFWDPVPADIRHIEENIGTHKRHTVTQTHRDTNAQAREHTHTHGHT